MKTYPSISKNIVLDTEICMFPKYDGSNIRAEYSHRQGWYKFGTRKELISDKNPFYQKAIPLFLEKYSSQLEKFFLCKNIQKAVCFLNFLGQIWNLANILMNRIMLC